MRWGLRCAINRGFPGRSQVISALQSSPLSRFARARAWCVQGGRGLRLRVSRWVQRALLVGILALAMPVAHAEDCPVFPDSLPADTKGVVSALQRLDRHLAVCAAQPRWHARRGALLLRLGRALEAAESLERALLLAPDFQAARLDYADALAQLGDLESARQLAQALLATPDIPPPAQHYLRQRLSDWASPRAGWQLRQQLGAHLGWESNLNGGPIADSIGLTLPEGVVDLPLDASGRPRRGFAMAYEWAGVGVRPLDDSLHAVLRGQLRLRDAGGSSADYLIGQIDAGLGWGGSPSGEGLLQAGVREQRFGDQRILAETRAALRYQWGGAPCRPRARLDHAWRDYPSAPELDGRQLGLALGLGCTSGRWLVELEARGAADQPRDAERPGGRQQLSELTLGAQWRSPPYRTVLEYAHGRVHDQRGYSPLLQFDARRNISRDAARIEWVRELRPGLEWVMSVDYFRQRSNLALFELDNLGLYFGARFRQ